MPAIKQSNYFSFDSSVAPMTYADQYIEITITVPTSKLYGLGEHTSKSFDTSVVDFKYKDFTRMFHTCAANAWF
jgi:hypothetical protein